MKKGVHCIWSRIQMETTGGKTKGDILDGGSCTWEDLANSSVEAYGWTCVLFVENHSEIWAVRDHLTLKLTR